MSDEQRFEAGDERRDRSNESKEARSIIDYRLLSLEEARDDHELRLREMKDAFSVQGFKLDAQGMKLDAIGAGLAEIKLTAERAETQVLAAKATAHSNFVRNMWASGLSLFTIVLTILGSYYFHR